MWVSSDTGVGVYSRQACDVYHSYFRQDVDWGGDASSCRESNNDTSTTIGFWMEMAKMQMVDAEEPTYIVVSTECAY